MDNEKHTHLFKLSRTNAILYFEVIARTVEDGAVLITRKGQLGGAMQEDIEPQYPKNVGRANETTPWQQAKLMADSKVSKLGDKGYKIINEWEYFDTEELYDHLHDLKGTDVHGRKIPMRAKDMAKGGKVTYPGYLQRKFDGMRAAVKEEYGTKIMRTRNGKGLFYLDHILDDLPQLPGGWEYDGELYHHDRSLQQIVSMVKREQPENANVQYRVYDLIGTGLPYYKRKRILNKLLRKAGPSVHRVKTYKVNSYDELMALFHRFKKEGYEGAMWRDPNALYDYGGHRSDALIKVKDFLEEEFEIIGVEEATGRDEGTAIFECITDEGVRFTVRPLGTREVRAEYLDNFEEKYLGKMLTVRFQNWTDGGKPFHHRGIIIRDYE